MPQQVFLSFVNETVELVMRFVGYFTTIGAGIAAIYGVVWFIARGKNLEQLKESLQGWKDVADSQKARIGELKEEIAELKTENAELKIEVTRLQELHEETRKLNLRLQGTVERLEKQLTELK